MHAIRNQQMSNLSSPSVDAYGRLPDGLGAGQKIVPLLFADRLSEPLQDQ
jgi:hypothetical protein